MDCTFHVWNFNVFSPPRSQVGGGNVLVWPGGSGKDLGEKMCQILRRGSPEDQILLQQGELLSRKKQTGSSIWAFKGKVLYYLKKINDKSFPATCRYSWACFRRRERSLSTMLRATLFFSSMTNGEFPL